MKLTDEQKRVYINSGGVCCPFCGSGSIQGGFVEIDSGQATQPMHCPDCGHHWTDLYRLTAIIPDE